MSVHEESANDGESERDKALETLQFLVQKVRAIFRSPGWISLLHKGHVYNPCPVAHRFVPPRMSNRWDLCFCSTQPTTVLRTRLACQLSDCQTSQHLFWEDGKPSCHHSLHVISDTQMVLGQVSKLWEPASGHLNRLGHKNNQCPSCGIENTAVGHHT
jgi:hypothetical protein